MPRANFKEIVKNLELPEKITGVYLDSSGFHIQSESKTVLAVKSNQYGSPMHAWDQLNKYLDLRLQGKLK